MSVYLTLQKPVGSTENYDRTITIQRCGNFPYELSLRFAQCCLRCGACFAAGYSWPDKFKNNKRVVKDIPIEKVIDDFKNIPLPSNRKKSYNWLRVLGGEPLLNDEYVEYLFNCLIHFCEINSELFNNGIIIQTNGIHLGKGRINVLKNKLDELYRVNSNVIVVIEISIKGTNPKEFKLITDPEDRLSLKEDELFKYNIQAYYNLKNLKQPNLRVTVIAGYGISESYLLTEGENPKSKITILFDENTPVYHSSLWSEEFEKLYNDYINDWKNFDSIFFKMPMYGIKDKFDYEWAKRALKQAKKIYGQRFYDAEYEKEKQQEIENKFSDILKKFFLKDNQTYYSTLIRK